MSWKNRVAPFRVTGRYPDLVHHQQGGVGEDPEPAPQLSLGLGPLEGPDQISQGPVVHPPAALRRPDRRADRQVSLFHPRRAQEHHVLLPPEEVQLVERVDLLPAQGGLGR